MVESGHADTASGVDWGRGEDEFVRHGQRNGVQPVGDRAGRLEVAQEVKSSVHLRQLDEVFQYQRQLHR